MDIVIYLSIYIRIFACMRPCVYIYLLVPGAEVYVRFSSTLRFAMKSLNILTESVFPFVCEEMHFFLYLLSYCMYMEGLCTDGYSMLEGMCISIYTHTCVEHMQILLGEFVYVGGYTLCNWPQSLHLYPRHAPATSFCVYVFGAYTSLYPDVYVYIYICMLT